MADKSCRGVPVVGFKPRAGDVYQFGRRYGSEYGAPCLFVVEAETAHRSGRRSFLTPEAAVRAARERFIDRLTALVCNRDGADLWRHLKGDPATEREQIVAALRLLRAGIDLDADGIAGVVAENRLWDEFTNPGK